MGRQRTALNGIWSICALTIHCRRLTPCHPRATIQHTDRGSQASSNDYQKLLAKHGFAVSMRGQGNGYDNSMVQAFFKSHQGGADLAQSYGKQDAKPKRRYGQYINGGLINQRRADQAALAWLEEAPWPLNQGLPTSRWATSTEARTRRMTTIGPTSDQFHQRVLPAVHWFRDRPMRCAHGCATTPVVQPQTGLQSFRFWQRKYSAISNAQPLTLLSNQAAQNKGVRAYHCPLRRPALLLWDQAEKSQDIPASSSPPSFDMINIVRTPDTWSCSVR